MQDFEKFTDELRESFPAPPDPFFSCFKPLKDFEEQEATWLVPGWIPEGQITLMAADGGTGKTSGWVDIAAAVSSGQRSILDPPGYNREPGVVLFLTTEDSVKKKLKKKLRQAGANMDNVITPDLSVDKDGSILKKLKFGNPWLSNVIRQLKPALIIFDPVQGFLPPKVNMGARNEMRDCIAPLVPLGEETGSSFLLVCHTNKRKGASGRDRIADSADLWDISRSVIMMGYTEENGIRYISNEKNNYEKLQETILFRINSKGQVEKTGCSWKRDREFQTMHAIASGRPKMDDCKSWIFEELAMAGGKIKSKDLETKAKEVGYAAQTFKVAKQEMRAEKMIDIVAEGSSKKGDRTWFIIIPTESPEEMEQLSLETPTPFDE